MATNAEKFAFTADDSIVRFLIQNQAGSLEKALSELVMNGIDAKSTRIDVNIIDHQTIEVVDNGCGFASRDEILGMFRNFGFDHSTKEQQAKGRCFGFFGLGRGQSLSFGKTQWLTNRFEMNTDIRNDLDTCFFLTEHPNIVHKGLKVTLDLYDRCSRMDIESLRRSIKRMLAYVDCEIFLDGELINEGVKSTRWTEQTDALLFKTKPNSHTGVDVYNMGVYVKTYSHQQFGVSGTLVSRIDYPFNLNMARNEVLDHSCDLWKDAKAILKKHATKRQKRKSITDEDRYFMVQQLLAGEADSETAKRRLFKDVTGKYHSLAMMNEHAAGTVALAESNHDQASENVHNSGVAFVLAPVTGEWLNASGATSLCQQLESIRKQCQYTVNGLFNNFTPACLNELRKAYAGELVGVPIEKWTKKERVYAAGLQAISRDLMLAVMNGAHQFVDYDHKAQARKILLGESSNRAQAWTNGSVSIHVDRDYLKACIDDGVDGIHRLLAVMVHEYLHPDSDENSHVHSPEFFEAYEAVITSRFYRPYALIEAMLKAIDRACKKEKLTRSNALIKTMEKSELLQAEQFSLAV